MINPQRNSTESVLTGLLGLYAASLGRSDLWLRIVMEHIDRESSVNIVTSSGTWNAFRNNWSKKHVEAISSTLESPFNLIDADETKRSILEFDTETPLIHNLEHDKELEPGVLALRYRSYDPSFWLPVIAYCLESVRHASDLTGLVDNFSIGYAFVCLSSKDPDVRKMAISILHRFEHLPEVSLSEPPR